MRRVFLRLIERPDLLKSFKPFCRTTVLLYVSTCLSNPIIDASLRYNLWICRCGRDLSNLLYHLPKLDLAACYLLSIFLFFLLNFLLHYLGDMRVFRIFFNLIFAAKGGNLKVCLCEGRCDFRSDSLKQTAAKYLMTLVVVKGEDIEARVACMYIGAGKSTCASITLQCTRL
jgi:hypothetical protein